MRVNGRIIVATLLITGTGLYTVWVQGASGRPIRIVVGGYVLAIIAGALDLIGGPVSEIVGMLLLLAAAVAVGTVFLPDFLGRVNTQRAQSAQGA